MSERPGQNLCQIRERRGQQLSILRRRSLVVDGPLSTLSFVVCHSPSRIFVMSNDVLKIYRYALPETLVPLVKSVEGLVYHLPSTLYEVGIRSAGSTSWVFLRTVTNC